MATEAKYGPGKKYSHWTKDPSRKKEVAALGRQRGLAKAKNDKARKAGKLPRSTRTSRQGSHVSISSEEILDQHASLLAARTEGWIAHHAESHNLPVAALSYRVGDALARASRRKVGGG